jgi:predicted GH43/DUF377 family glycosyl hydrolase
MVRGTDFNEDGRWAFEQERSRFASNRVELVATSGDSTSRADEIPDGSMDVVFLDRAHQWHAISGDLERWWGKVKPGGLYAGHDYRSNVWVDVAPAVNLWAQKHSLVVHHEKPHVWWVQKPGASGWYRATLTDVDTLVPAQNAFNPAVCETSSGEWLFAFRTTSVGWDHGRIWIGELDRRTLQLTRQPDLLVLGPDHLQYEDPRLYVFGGEVQLCVAVSHFTNPMTTEVWMTALEKSGGRWHVRQPVRCYPSPERRLREKNWIFFEWQRKLHALYEMDPWAVRCFEQGDTAGTEVYRGPGLGWKYGQARGGSPFFRVPNGNWWAFFHSSLPSERYFREYVTGLVEVDPENLKPLRMTNRPVLLEEEPSAGWTGYPVLWVAGAIPVGDEVLISIGKNDQSCQLRLEPLAELEKTLDGSRLSLSF